MRADIVIPLLVYSFGIYAFGSILVYQFQDWREGRRTCRERIAWHSTIVGTAIWTVCLLWFSTLAALTLLQLKPDFDTLTLQLAQFVMQLLFPPLIAHTFYADASQAEPRLRRAGWRWGIALFYLAALSICGGSLLVFLGVWDLPGKTVGAATGIWTGFAFLLAAVLSVAMMRVAGTGHEDAGERSSRRWMSGLFGLMILLVVIIVAGHIVGMPFLPGLGVIGSSMPLLFCVVAFYHEARFAFFDLFLKRALAGFATLVLLTLYIALVFPLFEGFELAGSGRWCWP